MQARKIIIGNLTADAVKGTKGEKEYYYFGIAENNGNSQDPIFTTCFLYGASPARAKLLTKGSSLYLYGYAKEELKENPNTGQVEINRTLNIIDMEILYHKNNTPKE